MYAWPIIHLIVLMTRFACFGDNLLAADINKEADLKFIWSRYMHCDFQSYSNKTWWRICSSGLRDTWDALTSHDAEQSAQGCVVLHLSHQGCATEWETAVTPSHQQSPLSSQTTPLPLPTPSCTPSPSSRSVNMALSQYDCDRNQIDSLWIEATYNAFRKVKVTFAI